MPPVILIFTSNIEIESCSGPNEMYTEELDVGNCDLDCRTFGCKKENMAADSSKWSPRCICGDNEQHYSLYIPSDYRRLSNGTCVLTSDPQCVAEFQPSAGFIYYLLILTHVKSDDFRTMCCSRSNI